MDKATLRKLLIKASQGQLSKLRNGHKVRVKPAMEGEGICLIVNPENYNRITRTFNKGKGSEISLSPQEIQENKEASEMMEGKGIFGKKFDRKLKKVLGKRGSKAVYGFSRKVLRPIVKRGLTTGLTALGTMATTAGVPPQLVAPAVAGLNKLGGDYIDNPTKFQRGNVGDIAKGYATDYAKQQLKGAVNDIISDQMRGEGLYAGRGLYAGGGLYAGMTRGRGCCGGRTCGGAVGLNGGMVNQVHPALQSQPYGANFQFSRTLPPSYQKN
jgi:hypothetical protein